MHDQRIIGDLPWFDVRAERPSELGRFFFHRCFTPSMPPLGGAFLRIDADCGYTLRSWSGTSNSV